MAESRTDEFWYSVSDTRCQFDEREFRFFA